MPVSRSRRFGDPAPGLEPWANLHGQALPVQHHQVGNVRVVTTSNQIDEYIQSPDSGFLVELRARLESLLSASNLTPLELATVRVWIARPELGVRGLADEERVSPAAVHARRRAIERKLPEFARAWKPKLRFISYRKRHA